MTPAASYAKALFDAANSRGKADVLARELEALSPLVLSMKHFFLNPSLPAAKQSEVILDCLGGRADPLTVEFFRLLAGRRHLKWLPAIRLCYETLYRKHSGEAIVNLRLPFAPSAELLSEIRLALADFSLYPHGRKDSVRFEVEIDEGLIGGFTAECAGRVLDMSIKTRLLKMA